MDRAGCKLAGHGERGRHHLVGGDGLRHEPDPFGLAPVEEVGGQQVVLRLGHTAQQWPDRRRMVAAGLPTAVTVAATDEAVAQRFCASLATPSFRLYHTTDLRGVEIGGAAKNVLAIACGVAAGRNLGASAQAALIARGFAELRRFGRALRRGGHGEEGEREARQADSMR
mgnify:CR=1 FL=1